MKTANLSTHKVKAQVSINQRWRYTMASQGDRSIYKKTGKLRINVISRRVSATTVAEKQ
jgi:hypothetical protein